MWKGFRPGLRTWSFFNQIQVWVRVNKFYQVQVKFEFKSEFKFQSNLLQNFEPIFHFLKETFQLKKKICKIVPEKYELNPNLNLIIFYKFEFEFKPSQIIQVTKLTVFLIKILTIKQCIMGNFGKLKIAIFREIFQILSLKLLKWTNFPKQARFCVPLPLLSRKKKF